MRKIRLSRKVRVKPKAAKKASFKVRRGTGATSLALKKKR
jgi:hypothetical protein